MKEISNIAYNWLLENNRVMTEPNISISESGSAVEKATATEIATEIATDAIVSHELWSFSSALVFIILVILVAVGILFGINTITNFDNIKADWANQRCSPLIMPFASVFGYNTKENFDFCMNKIFNTFSLPFIGSIGSIFSDFATFLFY